MHRTSGRWRLGFALALTTAVCWGLLPIALKIALQGLDPYTITWWRFTVATVVLGVVLGASRRLPSLSGLGRQGWLLLCIALLGMVGNYVLYILALQHASPSVTQTVIQLSPIFLLLGGLAVFGERFSPRQWLGFAILIPGLLLFFNRRLPELAHPSGGLGLGVVLLVGAAIIWAGYGLAQKQLLKRLSSQQILWILYVGSVALLLPLAEPGAVRELDGLQLGVLAFCCANTLIGYGAFAEALEHWEVSRVSAVLALAPLCTLGGMWLVNRLAPAILPPEQLNALSVGGALLVVMGSALCALGRTESAEAQH
jgi:drug/metabolite transporter (DMT)-like permease